MLNTGCRIFLNQMNLYAELNGFMLQKYFLTSKMTEISINV